jgi:hypothetical protein
LVKNGTKFVTDSPIDAWGEDDDIIATVQKHGFHVVRQSEHIIDDERWLKLTVVADRDITVADVVEMMREAEVEYFLGDVGVSDEVMKELYTIELDDDGDW